MRVLKVKHLKSIIVFLIFLYILYVLTWSNDPEKMPGYKKKCNLAHATYVIQELVCYKRI